PRTGKSIRVRAREVEWSEGGGPHSRRRMNRQPADSNSKPDLSPPVWPRYRKKTCENQGCKARIEVVPRRCRAMACAGPERRETRNPAACDSRSVAAAPAQAERGNNKAAAQN